MSKYYEAIPINEPKVQDLNSNEQPKFDTIKHVYKPLKDQEFLYKTNQYFEYIFNIEKNKLTPSDYIKLYFPQCFTRRRIKRLQDQLDYLIHMGNHSYIIDMSCIYLPKALKIYKKIMYLKLNGVL